MFVLMSPSMYFFEWSWIDENIYPGTLVAQPIAGTVRVRVWRDVGGAGAGGRALMSVCRRPSSCMTLMPVELYRGHVVVVDDDDEMSEGLTCNKRAAPTPQLTPLVGGFVPSAWTAVMPSSNKFCGTCAAALYTFAYARCSPAGGRYG